MIEPFFKSRVHWKLKFAQSLRSAPPRLRPSKNNQFPALAAQNRRSTPPLEVNAQKARAPLPAYQRRDRLFHPFRSNLRHLESLTGSPGQTQTA
jgi:hypothetical protein